MSTELRRAGVESAGGECGRTAALMGFPSWIPPLCTRCCGASKPPGTLCYKSMDSRGGRKSMTTIEGAAKSATIESVLQETRVFPPPEAMVKQANISGMAAYEAM